MDDPKQTASDLGPALVSQRWAASTVTQSEARLAVDAEFGSSSLPTFVNYSPDAE